MSTENTKLCYNKSDAASAPAFYPRCVFSQDGNALAVSRQRIDGADCVTHILIKNMSCSYV